MQNKLQWNIRDIYVLLMREIEPELLPDNFAMLDRKYVGETQDEKKMRYERYTKAFELFLQRFEVFMRTLKGKVSEVSKELRSELESASDQKDASILQKINSFLQTT